MNKKILVKVVIVVGFLLGILVGKMVSPSEVKPEVKEVREPKIVEVPIVIEHRGVPVPTDNPYFNIPLSHRLQDYLYEICEQENVPITLILAMIETESGFNAEIVSPTDDYGLMQINKINHEWLEEKYRTGDFLNPYQNVFCGVRIIGKLIEKYNDYEFALMAYNMGEGGTRKYWDKGIYSSKYSRKIMDLKEKYDEEVGE